MITLGSTRGRYKVNCITTADQNIPGLENDVYPHFDLPVNIRQVETIAASSTRVENHPIFTLQKVHPLTVPSVTTFSSLLTRNVRRSIRAIT
jgi:hypothetical protein